MDNIPTSPIQGEELRNKHIYFAHKSERKSFAEIAKQYGISRQRAHQIYHKEKILQNGIHIKLLGIFKYDKS